VILIATYCSFHPDAWQQVMVALCYSHSALRSRSAICINLRPPGKNSSVARLIIGAHEYVMAQQRFELAGIGAADWWRVAPGVRPTGIGFVYGIML
jgi:hypothetical protein